MRIAAPEDRAFIESIIAHPEVERFVRHDAAPWPVDVSPYLVPPHRALLFDGGCFLLVWQGHGRVECHTNFLPEHRGGEVVAAAREALEHVFLDTNVTSVVTKVPRNNLAADRFTRLMGFRLRFERPDAWIRNGERFPIRYYELDIDDWIGMAPGSVDERYADALARMIARGNQAKGVFIYNRWAQFAGVAAHEEQTPCL